MKWYERSRRRILFDFHVADWDEKFLSRFDAAAFAECVRKANATAATVFANTHTGLCNYPTKVGAPHGRMNGRDFLGEMIAECHARAIDVVVYYCTVYVEHYWTAHPEARSVDARGESLREVMNSHGHPRRFCTCCPNDAGYREFVVAQLQEICEGYEFEGVWPDMTWWPKVCYCASCRERYLSETGSEIPRTVDWRDPAWVRFQRARQRWLREYAHLITSTIRSAKPGVTVAHQSGGFASDWVFGISAEQAEETDWLSADLYGDRYNMSYQAKVFHSLSKTKPFEHINTWCWPHIHEHVVTRTEDHMRLTALSALMNDGAMTFIDAVDPDGSVHERHYKTVSRIFRELERHEPHAGGVPIRDVAIYRSYDSNMDPAEKRTSDVGDTCSPRERPGGRETHYDAAEDLAKTLTQHHVPYGVVTKQNLDSLAGYRALLLPNVAMLDSDELDAIREFVREGGGLYASKHTSTISHDGEALDDFALGEVLGVTLEGETAEDVTYVTPATRPELFGPFSTEYPITLYGTQLTTRLRGGAKALATVTLPYTDPHGTEYACLLTDPPGARTDHPALVLNRYGDGSAVYAAGVLETCAHQSQRAVLARILRLLSGGRYRIEVEAPACIEVQMYDRPDENRYVIHVLNHQQELPNIPVRGVKVDVDAGGRSAVRLARPVDGSTVEFEADDGRMRFTIPEVVDYCLLSLEYEPHPAPRRERARKVGVS